MKKADQYYFLTEENCTAGPVHQGTIKNLPDQTWCWRDGADEGFYAFQWRDAIGTSKKPWPLWNWIVVLPVFLFLGGIIGAIVWATLLIVAQMKQGGAK